MRILIPSIAALFFFSNFVGAATYYVSPQGNDNADGRAPDRAWRTCREVNDFKFDAGDLVLFDRKGQWREHLQASSSGESGRPITYDAYGDGGKPRILGSDLLDNAKFTSAGPGKYSCPIAARADAALCNHEFIPSSWTGGTLTITSGTDPRSDGKTYSACVRGNVLFSNRKNHLVFRNLIVDETAGQLSEGSVQGYGIRIEGSSDVLLESCEAYRCGRHHIAVINSTEFVGRHLMSAFALPQMPGDNTAYVSYADAGAPVAKCTSEWDDIQANHLQNGNGGEYPMFVSHGDHQGLTTLENSIATSKISFMSAPVVVKRTTIKGNASIENWGKGVLIDGVTLLDSSAIDQWATGGTIQNCIANLTPTGTGPTGYGTAIILRDKANHNVIQFNTLVTGRFSCLEIAGENAATICFGNIMVADGNTIATASGGVGAGDIAAADYNFFNRGATFSGKHFTAWQAAGFDRHSLSGDPRFDGSKAEHFVLKMDSPCIAAAKVPVENVPAFDFAGRKRPATSPSIGAFEGSVTR